MSRRARRVFWKWFWRFAILTITVQLFSIIGNQHLSMIMQTDTLDQLNYIRQEGESADTDTENRPQGNSEPQTSISSVILTAAERDLVERVVAAEARGEDLQGQMGVAQVILDRAVLWDMQVSDVVLAAGQFATPYQGEITDDIKLAVANVFDGGVRVFLEPVTHFAEGDPYWSSGKASRGSIGRHEFWY